MNEKTLLLILNDAVACAGIEEILQSVDTEQPSIVRQILTEIAANKFSVVAETKVVV